MDGQITLTEAISSVTYDRYGRPHKTPAWMDKPRCETCKHWDRLPVDDQPPDGWGVKGQCDVIHDASQIGYINTDGCSWCCRYEGRY